MTKHHNEDYKISTVKHYLTKYKNLTKTCKEFDCLTSHGNKNVD